MSFEENIQQLEEIATNLEKGDLPLDKMLEMFEKGVSLSRKCTAELENAEKKVRIILQQGSDENGEQDVISDFSNSSGDISGQEVRTKESE